MDHLDYDALNVLKDVMGEDFPLLIETFVQDSDVRLEQLAVMINADELRDTIRRSAHSFKGSSSNLGAQKLSGLCAALEKKAMAAGEVGELIIAFEEIQQEFIKVKALLITMV
jgi:histidine phosphotransfer protein HptB